MEVLLHRIKDADVDEIFKNYTVASYGHLMLEPIRADQETMEQKRQALEWWLATFAQGDGNADERQDLVLEAIESSPGALGDLIFALCDDQYFQEPLYHMLNQHTAHPDLTRR